MRNDPTLAEANDSLTARMPARWTELAAEEVALSPAERRAARRRAREAAALLVGCVPATATMAPRPRPRGAGRPARRSGSSSATASSDPGDDGEPAPPRRALAGVAS